MTRALRGTGRFFFGFDLALAEEAFEAVELADADFEALEAFDDFDLDVSEVVSSEDGVPADDATEEEESVTISEDLRLLTSILDTSVAFRAKSKILVFELSLPCVLLIELSPLAFLVCQRSIKGVFETLPPQKFLQATTR